MPNYFQPRFNDSLPQIQKTGQLYSLNYGTNYHSPPEPTTISMLFSFRVDDQPQFGEGTLWAASAVATENNRTLVKTIVLGMFSRLKCTDFCFCHSYALIFLRYNQSFIIDWHCSTWKLQ